MASVEETAAENNTIEEKQEANVEEDKSIGQKAFDFVKELVVLVVTAFVLAYIFKTFIFQPFKVDMSSMMPNVQPNYRVLVNKFIYRFANPSRGDVITFYSNEPMNNTNIFPFSLFSESRRILIKRVIATEGQTIEIKNGQVYINRKMIKEKYVKIRDFQGYGPLTVPKGKIFAMGDNRPNSKDSRTFGPVKKTDILGKAFFVYWPPGAVKTL